eukprot:900142-Prymnesium_polylepis.2
MPRTIEVDSPAAATTWSKKRATFASTFAGFRSNSHRLASPAYAEEVDATAHSLAGHVDNSSHSGPFAPCGRIASVSMLTRESRSLLSLASVASSKNSHGARPAATCSRRRVSTASPPAGCAPSAPLASISGNVRARAAV